VLPPGHSCGTKHKLVCFPVRGLVHVLVLR
jgi:hypothetical protein